MHVQVRINRKVKMKSTKTQCYVAEKKFRERYPKIQLRSSSQRSTQLPFESGTSRAISTVGILLCLSFLVSLVLQYWSVRSSKRKGLQETKQELLFHSNQDQFVRGCLRGRCLGTLKDVKETYIDALVKNYFSDAGVVSVMTTLLDPRLPSLVEQSQLNEYGIMEVG